MPRFKVRKGHDAWNLYEAIVEAETAKQAEKLAAELDLEWIDIGETTEFDHWEIMEGSAEEIDDDEGS